MLDLFNFDKFVFALKACTSFSARFSRKSDTMDFKLLFLSLATLAVVMVTGKEDSGDMNRRLPVSNIILDVEESLLVGLNF